MKAVVTGGAGFIGSHLVERLNLEGYEVLVIDDLSSGASRISVIERAGARIEVQDITADKAKAAVKAFGPGQIFHLAAQMSVTRSVAAPVHDANVNIIGMLQMLEAAREVDAHFVNTSSGGAMYGELSNGLERFNEDYVGYPTSPYGISKMISGQYLRLYRNTYRLRCVNLAPSNIYGPRQDPHGEAGVVAIWSQRLLSGQDSVIFGDGKQTRDFLYVTDLVDAYLRAVTHDGGETFNIATGVETSVADLYKTMASIVGTTSEPRHEPARAGDAYRMALDVGKAAKKLGWKAQTQLTDGLRSTLDWFRDQISV